VGEQRLKGRKCRKETEENVDKKVVRDLGEKERRLLGSFAALRTEKRKTIKPGERRIN